MFGRGSSATSNSKVGLEQLIKRATDETLTADNWQYILEVCDKISQDPEDSTKQAIKFVTARLALKDANVNLRTLSLLVAVAENCGSRMKQEIASSSFLNDVLLKKLGDRKVHVTVKFKVAECIKQLNDSFKGDPSLKPMADGYRKVEKNYPQYLGGASGKPSASGPSKPAKKEISQKDKAKEEEELQRVLKDSLMEYEREQNIKKNSIMSYVDSDKPLPEIQSSQNKQENERKQNSFTPEQTIATVTKVRALYDLISYEPDELSFRKNDIITVLESVYRDWWKGSLPSGEVGIFPLNYVTPVVTKSAGELAKENDIEQKILSIDSRKVDKLLALLSSQQDQINEDEVTRLYNEIVPIRPTVGKFIDKYSIRKEELLQLNAQLNSEAKLYNELMDKSISQRANQGRNQQLQQQYNLAPYPTGGFNSPPQQQQQQQQQQQPQQPQQPQYTMSGPAPVQAQGQPDHLYSQPTSSGFGNGGLADYSQYQRMSSPPQAFFEQPQYQGQGPQQPQSSNQSHQLSNQSPYSHQPPQQRPSQQFSNINNFPDVNNIQ